MVYKCPYSSKLYKPINSLRPCSFLPKPRGLEGIKGDLIPYKSKSLSFPSNPLHSPWVGMKRTSPYFFTFLCGLSHVRTYEQVSRVHLRASTWSLRPILHFLFTGMLWTIIFFIKHLCEFEVQIWPVWELLQNLCGSLNVDSLTENVSPWFSMVNSMQTVTLCIE